MTSIFEGNPSKQGLFQTKQRSFGFQVGVVYVHSSSSLQAFKKNESWQVEYLMFFGAGSSSAPTGEVLFVQKKRVWTTLTLPRNNFRFFRRSNLWRPMKASVKTPGIWKGQRSQGLGLQRGSWGKGISFIGIYRRTPRKCQPTLLLQDY